MSSMQSFYAVTIELIDLLERIKPQERDEKFGLVEQLLDHRENLISSMQPPYSDEDKELGKRLIELNQKVSMLLTKEKTAVQKDIKQLSAKKESTNKYINPYQSLSNDGMFYDKRK